MLRHTRNHACLRISLAFDVDFSAKLTFRITTGLVSWHKIKILCKIICSSGVPVALSVALIQLIIYLAHQILCFTIPSSLLTLSFNLAFVSFCSTLHHLCLSFLPHSFIRRFTSMCICLSINSCLSMQTLTSLLQLLPPDVLSLYIRRLPMEHFVSCALYLFRIAAQQNSLSQCPTVALITTSQLVLAIAHGASISHSITPICSRIPCCHAMEQLLDAACFCPPSQIHSENSQAISNGLTFHYPCPFLCTFGLPDIIHQSSHLSISLHFCFSIHPYLLLLIGSKITSKYAICGSYLKLLSMIYIGHIHIAFSDEI